MFYWVINLVLPMYIMTACLGAVFFVPPGDMADRCSISLTILLTQVNPNPNPNPSPRPHPNPMAQVGFNYSTLTLTLTLALTSQPHPDPMTQVGFKYSIGDKLPSVSYITYIDMYMLLCFAVTFIVVVMQAMAAAGAYIEPMTISELPPGPWWSSSILEHGAWPFRTWPPIAAFYFFSWSGLHVVGLPLALFYYRVWTSRDAESRMWRYDKRLVRALYVGPLDRLRGRHGLPEVGNDALREYIADAFEELGADCSQISIFETSDFDPKARRPKINSAFGVVLLRDREDEYEVADVLNLYHHTAREHRERADGSTEKSSQLRQLNVKVEPLGTAFTAIKQNDGRVVNLLDEAKPLRREGKVKVLPVS